MEGHMMTDNLSKLAYSGPIMDWTESPTQTPSQTMHTTK